MKRNKVEVFIKQKIFVIASFLIMIAMVITFSLVYTNGSSKANSTRLNLSEKQLLLLNNYLYLTNGSKQGPIINNLNSLKTNNKYDSALIESPASGIKDSDMIEILTEIENDPILSNLVIVDSINNDIKAICLVPKNRVNTKNAEAAIIFQGTKALECSWLDNLEGATQTDTKLQLEAGDFHETCELKYNVTNVSGHSKGGNLSQYITITNGQNVRTCVSFNGQGFSQEFIDQYKTNINMYAQKIVSISSYKEPVHALLTTVASNVLFVKTSDDIDPISSHISSVLYNKTYFDKYGMYKPEVLTEESSLAVNINKLTDKTVENIDADTLQHISEISAPYIAYLMPLMQDTVAREDVSTVQALYEETLKRINSENTTLTEDELDAVSQYTVCQSVFDANNSAN